MKTIAVLTIIAFAAFVGIGAHVAGMTAYALMPLGFGLVAGMVVEDWR